MLAYILWGDRIPESGATSRAPKRDWSRELRGCGPRAGGYVSRSGNFAFDDYRDAELKRLDEERRRLEEERREFEAYVHDLRRARDKEEFDRFMADRAASADARTTAARRSTSDRGADHSQGIDDADGGAEMAPPFSFREVAIPRGIRPCDYRRATDSTRGRRLAWPSSPAARRSRCPTSFEVATDAGVVAVDLRRHPRARNYTLRVAGPARPPVLTMPTRGSLARGARASSTATPAGSSARSTSCRRRPPIADGAPIPLPRRHARHPPRARRARHGRRRSTTATARRSSSPARREHLRRRVIDFLKREAQARPRVGGHPPRR